MHDELAMRGVHLGGGHPLSRWESGGITQCFELLDAKSCTLVQFLYKNLASDEDVSQRDGKIFSSVLHDL